MYSKLILSNSSWTEKSLIRRISIFCETQGQANIFPSPRYLQEKLVSANNSFITPKPPYNISIALTLPIWFLRFNEQLVRSLARLRDRWRKTLKGRASYPRRSTKTNLRFNYVSAPIQSNYIISIISITVALVFKMSFFFSGRKCNDSFCDAIQ